MKSIHMYIIREEQPIDNYGYFGKDSHLGLYLNSLNEAHFYQTHYEALEQNEMGIILKVKLTMI